jgi:hypothetical protein
MNPFRFIRAFFSYLSAKVLPYQLQPSYIVERVRTKLQSATAKLEAAADDIHVKKPKTGHPWHWYLLRGLIVVAVLVALGWLNHVLDLDKVLRSPWPVLHKIWLPLLFILGCALYWLGLWLWRLLAPEKVVSEYPDIDDAWQEGIAALRQAGIAVGQVPLFLVLGRPHRSSKQLFDASQMNFPVRHIPRKPEAPIHITGSAEGIFVTCEGASLLGRQADLLRPDATPAMNGASQVTAPAAPEIPEGPPVIEYEQQAQTPGTPAATATATGSASPVLLLADEPVAQAFRVRRSHVSLLKNAEETARLTDRLAYLCRLMVRQRQPYCPINGVLVVLPLEATDTVEDASQTGAICQHDLATLRATLQVHAPLYVVLADMENVPGFCELLEQFPDARQRQYVLGQPFPLMPDADAQDVPRMIGHGVEWLFDTLFPTNVYRLLKVETPGREQRPDVVRMNGRLFELLVQMRERQKRVVHILTRGIAGKSEGPLLFGGCFLAGTGVDAAREQAFVHGVLRQLIENQNYVSWTKDALDEERDYRRWTRSGYLVILGILITAITVGYMYWPR